MIVFFYYWRIDIIFVFYRAFDKTHPAFVDSLLFHFYIHLFCDDIIRAERWGTLWFEWGLISITEEKFHEGIISKSFRGYVRCGPWF